MRTTNHQLRRTLAIVKLEQQVNLNREIFFPHEPIEEMIDLVLLECKRKGLELILDYKYPFSFEPSCTVIREESSRCFSIFSQMPSSLQPLDMCTLVQA